MNIQNLQDKVITEQILCWKKIIFPYFNALSAGQIKTKAHDQDFQTIADIESENYLTSKLKAMLPGSLVMGEEAVADGRVGLDLFTKANPDKYIWVIDPIDGTHNFVHGKDDFAIIIALVKNNETLAGWIHKPLSGETVWAFKGDGAQHEWVDTKVSQRSDLRDLIGYTPLMYSKKSPYQAHFNQCAAYVASLDNLRCAGTQYMNIATGQADFYIAPHSKPWDHLAGTLITQEAGGIVTQWDSSIYKPSDNQVYLITANNQQSYDNLQNRFLKPIRP